MNPENRTKCLDLHITHNCNLTCESCSDFTNHGFSWMITLEEVKKWIGTWCNRVTPDIFNILGGEPTLHKDLVEILYLCREMWGNKQKINLITNGFFVHHHGTLSKALIENNIKLCVSIHSREKKYIQKLKKNINLIKSWKINDGINVDFLTRESLHWNIIYKGYGSSILPFEDNDPESSWRNCYSDPFKCFQLYENKLWKCPPITYLNLMSEKYNLSNKWDQYLKYSPLTEDCSDEELEIFWNSGCLDICSMCPAKKIKIQSKKDPLMGVNESENYGHYYQ